MDRLFFKYLTPLLVITITPVLAIGLLLFFFLKNNIVELESSLIRQNSESLAQEIAYKNEAIAKNESLFIENEIDRIRNKLNVMETFPEFVNKDLDEINGYVENLVANEPAISEVNVVDKWGSVVYQKLSPALLVSEEISDSGLHEAFKKLEGKTSYVSAVMVSNTTQMPYVIIGQGILDYSGSFIGSLIVQLDLSFIREIVADKGVGKNGFLYIISEEGILISHPSKKEFLQNPDYSKYEYITRILKAKNGTIQQNDNLLSFYTNKYSWTTIIEIPVKYALASVEDNKRFILTFVNSTMKSIAYFTVLIILFGLLISGIAAIFITRRITAAITKFTQATRKISEGELSHQIEKQSNDEIGELTDSFNKMTDELRKEREELLKSNDYIKQNAEEILRGARQERSTQIHLGELEKSLNRIKNQLKKFQNEYAGADDDGEKENMENAINDIEQIDHFMRDLFENSTINTKISDFKLVDCMEIFESVVEKLKTQVQSNDASIKCSRLPKVRAISSNIFQLFENLIDNAIKYQNNRSPEIFVSAEEKENEWQFCVKDNGIGIPKEKIPGIFNTVKTGGNGKSNTDFHVGLAICKKIVERHEGRIWVKSEPGEGSRIYFTIKKF